MPALACLIVCQTTVSILLAFPDYFPPNFRSDFLLGRRAYFFGFYQWAFYAHIISGPFVLISGLALLSETVRRRLPAWHRRLGRGQVLCVIFVVAPSGLWMAWYASGGVAVAIAFAALAVATGLCAAMGWRCAVQRRYELHRVWMLRCYALLCSTVVLRKLGGLSELVGAEWTYPYAAWVSWLLPLALLEAVRAIQRSPRLHRLST